MVLPLNMGANLYAKRVPLQLIGGLAHIKLFSYLVKVVHQIFLGNSPTQILGDFTKQSSAFHQNDCLKMKELISKF